MYQYRVEDYANPMPSVAFADVLNGYARDGWRCIAVYTPVSHTATIVLERVVDTPDAPPTGQ